MYTGERLYLKKIKKITKIPKNFKIDHHNKFQLRDKYLASIKNEMNLKIYNSSFIYIYAFLNK